MEHGAIPDCHKSCFYGLIDGKPELIGTLSAGKGPGAVAWHTVGAQYLLALYSWCFLFAVCSRSLVSVWPRCWGPSERLLAEWT